ncbi:MAG: tetratricopeptide repeat protein, partial [Myxococcota bacterium]
NFWDKAKKSNSAYAKGVARHLWSRLRQGESLEPIARELERLRSRTLAPYSKAAVLLTEAELAYRARNPKAAADSVKEAIEIRGETPRLLSALGRYTAFAGGAKEGLNLQRKAFESNPGNVGYLFGWVHAALLSGQIDQALAALNAQQKRFGEQRSFRLLRARVLVEAGKLKPAQKIFNEILSVRKTQPDALAGLGHIEWKRKNYDRARAYYERALTERSRFPEVLESVGLMFVQMGAAEDGHARLLEAEKQYLERGVELLKLRAFHRKASQALGTSSQATVWRKKLESW